MYMVNVLNGKILTHLSTPCNLVKDLDTKDSFFSKAYCSMGILFAIFFLVVIQPTPSKTTQFERMFGSILQEVKDLSSRTKEYSRYGIPEQQNPLINEVKLSDESLLNAITKKKKIDLDKVIRIDGIMALSPTLMCKVNTDIWLRLDNVHDLSGKFSKNSFFADFAGTKFHAAVPAVYLNQQYGITVLIAAFPSHALDYADLDKWNWEDIKSLFFSSFLARVFFPALLECTNTVTRLRYQSLAKQALREQKFSPDKDFAIGIAMEDWELICKQMNRRVHAFREELGWKLNVGIYRMGQNVELQSDFQAKNGLDFTELLGLKTFLTELQISNIMFHVTYCFRVKPSEKSFGSILYLNLSQIKNFIGIGTGFNIYNTFGFSRIPGFTLSRFSVSGKKSIEAMYKKLFQKHLLSYFKQLNNKIHIAFTNALQLNYVQSYLGFTHAVFPRRYVPHAAGPASRMILNGPSQYLYDMFKRDWYYWKHIIEEIESGEVYFRIEFVFELSFPFETRLSTLEDIEGNRTEFTFCNNIMSFFVDSMHSANKETKFLGNVAYKLVENMNVVNSFTDIARKQIGSLYTSMVCPLLHGVSSSKTFFDATVNEQLLFTVHLAENLMLYLYNGEVAYMKDYSLLSKVYGVHFKQDILLKNVHLIKDKCGKDHAVYVGSKNVMDKLPQGYVPWLRDYKTGESAQKFFIIRRLNLAYGTCKHNNLCIVFLYLDSVLMYLQRNKHPILKDKKMPIYKWLSKENYLREKPSLPLTFVSAKAVARHMLNKQFFNPAIDIFAAYFSKDNDFRMASYRDLSVDISSYITEMLLSVVLFYMKNDWMSIYYSIDSCTNFQVSCDVDINYILRPERNSLIRGDAEDFFQLRGEYTRFDFSIPNFLVKEIVENVFKEMSDVNGLAIPKLSIDKIDIIRMHVLPILFRIWYANNKFSPSTFQRYIYYSSYMLCKYLKNFNIWHRKLIDIPESSLNAYAHTKKVSINFFKHIGLIHDNRDVISLDEVKSIHNYWSGNTTDLQQIVSQASPEIIEKYYFYSDVKSRFHFSICDNFNIDYTKVNQFGDIFQEEDIPYFPNVYYFFYSIEQDYSIADLNNAFVLRVSPQSEKIFWNITMPENIQPKFLPLFLDWNAKSIANKGLYEHNHDPSKYTVNKNGVFFDSDQDIVYDTPIQVTSGDFVSFKPEFLTFLKVTPFEINTADKKIITAWHSEKYVETQDDIEVGQPNFEYTCNENQVENGDFISTQPTEVNIHPFSVAQCEKISPDENDEGGIKQRKLKKKQLAVIENLPHPTIEPVERKVGRPKTDGVKQNALKTASARAARWCKRSNEDDNTVIICKGIKFLLPKIVLTDIRNDKSINFHKLEDLNSNLDTEKCVKEKSLPTETEPIINELAECFHSVDSGVIICSDISINYANHLPQNEEISSLDFNELRYCAENADVSNVAVVNEDFGDGPTVLCYPSFIPTEVNFVDDFFFVSVPADNNCLYNTFSFLLYGKVSSKLVNDLKVFLANLVDYDNLRSEKFSGLSLQVASEHLFKSGDSVLKRTVDALTNEIRTANVWGPDEVILLMSYLLNKNIFVLFLQTSEIEFDWKTFQWTGPPVGTFTFPNKNELNMFGQPFMISFVQRYRRKNRFFEGFHYEAVVYKSYISKFEMLSDKSQLTAYYTFDEYVNKYKSRFERNGEWVQSSDRRRQGDDSFITYINI